MKRSHNFRVGVTKTFVVVLGVFSIAWSSVSFRIHWDEMDLANSASQILSGELFSEKQLSLLSQRVNSTPVASLRSLAVVDVAVIRQRLLEQALSNSKPAQPFAPELRDIEASVGDALSGAPANSFLWLMEYWLGVQGPGASGIRLGLLRMSYLSGPNEGWIALKRNPVALNVFSALPIDLAEQVLTEFAGLVRAGFYLDAANILAGPGWTIRDQLLARLGPINENGRKEFARALEKRGLDGAMVPGTEQKPSRPF